MTPIPKLKNPTISDYRPISLLPLISKAFERLVLKKWVFPVIVHKLDRWQFAFTPGPGKGCTNALTLIQHLTLSHLDEKSGAVRMLLVDLSKAFDKATRSSVISALDGLKISPLIIYWIHNYMSNRYQAVRINGNNSAWMEVTSGVPQGSVMGPVLFAAIMDELKPKCSNSSLIKYADDLTLLHYIMTIFSRNGSTLQTGVTKYSSPQISRKQRLLI
jgi:hypothetical protein